MPTQAFTTSEWSSIRDTLAASPESFGFPERRDGSLLAGSFNIRKLGNLHGRDEETWQFLTDICVRFDVLAIQEIQDNLDGLRELLRRMGDEFDVVVSDKTGADDCFGALFHSTKLYRISPPPARKASFICVFSTTTSTTPVTTTLSAVHMILTMLSEYFITADIARPRKL